MPFLMLHELIVDKHSFVIVLQIRSKKVSFPNCMVNDRICSFRGNVLVADLFDFLFTDLLVFLTTVSFMFSERRVCVQMILLLLRTCIVRVCTLVGYEEEYISSLTCSYLITTHYWTICF